jgi:Xaa-Pro aminopeptidase
MERPKSITESEFLAKTIHLKTVLSTYGFSRMLLQSEGAMRWLTGLRHQVVDIHPNAPTTVNALVDIDGSSLSITFYSDPWEEARVRDIMRLDIFSLDGIKVDYAGEHPQATNSTTLLPSNPRYSEIEREIVSPLVQGLEGNQWDKLLWLIDESRQTLLELSAELHSGMTGWELRGKVYEAYHKRHLELNLVMLGFNGTKTHCHPVVMDDSCVEEGTIVKLVVGARYFDMFHSASQLVKIGTEPTSNELLVHEALTDAALAYADQFQAGVDEDTLYKSLGPIFSETARKYDLPAFEKSAYLHHGGGPLSPLGNRDFVVTENGRRPLFPNTLFSINPVDAIEFLKFELQGVVMPKGSPVVLDEFSWCTDENLFTTHAFFGHPLKLPTIISNNRR